MAHCSEAEQESILSSRSVAQAYRSDVLSLSKGVRLLGFKTRKPAPFDTRSTTFRATQDASPASSRGLKSTICLMCHCQGRNRLWTL